MPGGQVGGSGMGLVGCTGRRNVVGQATQGGSMMRKCGAIVGAIAVATACASEPGSNTPSRFSERPHLRQETVREPSVVDLPVLTRCGLALSVPDAPLFVRQRVHYVSRAGGGRGAVREVCELIMHAQGTLEQKLQTYLK